MTGSHLSSPGKLLTASFGRLLYIPGGRRMCQRMVLAHTCVHPSPTTPQRFILAHGHQPRGLSRISSLGRPHPEGRSAGRKPLPDHAGESTLLREQERSRSSEEVVPGRSVFPSGEPGMSGNFWMSQEGCQVPCLTSRRNM